jgi:hypothetical protein
MNDGVRIGKSAWVNGYARPAFRSANQTTAPGLRIDALAPDLHHHSQVQLTEQWLDRANDPSLAADDNALSNLERPLTAETPGRNDLLAPAKLIPIAQHRHPHDL